MGKRNRLFRRFKFLLFLFIILIIISNVYYKFTYPLSYKGLIHKYAKEYNIDPYLVAAIINVESNFNKNAISPKEARGLMQISATTGEWAARDLNIENFHLDLLYEPEINIRIGTWYLDQLNREFGDKIQLILAAYNGGSGNVNKWLQDENYCEDGESLKKIPFKETEQYIEKVLKNQNIYKRLYKGEFNGEMEENEPYFLQFFIRFKKIIKNLMIIGK